MRLHLLAALVALGAVAPAATASKLPATGVDTTRTGASAPGDPYRYIALPAKGGSSTQLIKLRREDGVVLRHRELPGRSVVAAVATDASTTGLSADGATLVLTEPRHARPPRVTHMVVIDTLTLRPTRRIEILGNFGLDGISPDGRRLYLVQYRSPNPLDYAVRAYDVAHRRLLPDPIVDPRNPDEKMAGFPMTRATSADGRWAYTLYGGGDEDFVHALDLQRGRAFCIDLEGLAPDELPAMKLVTGHRRVDLVNPSGEVVRRIDASTFRVTEPPAPKAAAPAGADEPGNGFPWGLAAAVAAVAAGALFVLRRRYAAGTDSAASRSASSSTPTVP